MTGRRVALVTGASSGIGEAVARRLAKSDVAVVVNSSRSRDAGEVLASELGLDASYEQCDISDERGVDSMIARIIDRYGRLDILVNNAGWTTRIPHGDIDALTNEVFRRTIEVNVLGTWFVTKAALAHLRTSPDPSVTTVTSVAGYRPTGSSMAYATSKAALNHLTKVLARSHGPVRFNAVAPGLVETPWTEAWEDQHERVRQSAPVGRSSTVDEQAAAVLACIDNPYMTGTVVVVDGGLSLVQ